MIIMDCGLWGITAVGNRRNWHGGWFGEKGISDKRPTARVWVDSVFDVQSAGGDYKRVEQMGERRENQVPAVFSAGVGAVESGCLEERAAAFGSAHA